MVPIGSSCCLKQFMKDHACRRNMAIAATKAVQLLMLINLHHELPRMNKSIVSLKDAIEKQEHHNALKAHTIANMQQRPSCNKCTSNNSARPIPSGNRHTCSGSHTATPRRYEVKSGTQRTAVHLRPYPPRRFPSSQLLATPWLYLSTVAPGRIAPSPALHLQMSHGQLQSCEEVGPADDLWCVGTAHVSWADQPADCRTANEPRRAQQRIVGSTALTEGRRLSHHQLKA